MRQVIFQWASVSQRQNCCAPGLHCILSGLQKKPPWELLPRGYPITFNTEGSMPIFTFGVRNFALNQYSGSVNWTKIQHFGSTNLEKEESWNLVRVSKLLDSILWIPKTLGLIFMGQQRKSGMDPRIKS